METDSTNLFDFWVQCKMLGISEETFLNVVSFQPEMQWLNDSQHWEMSEAGYCPVWDMLERYSFPVYMEYFYINDMLLQERKKIEKVFKKIKKYTIVEKLEFSRLDKHRFKLQLPITDNDITLLKQNLNFD
jgi:hypothetical protein